MRRHCDSSPVQVLSSPAWQEDSSTRPALIGGVLTMMTTRVIRSIWLLLVLMQHCPSTLSSSSSWMSTSKTTLLVHAATGTSRFQVFIPQSLKKDDGYDHRDALFGIPPYGASIQQQLYYANSTLCDTTVDTSGGYPTREKEKNGKMKPWPSPFILMVDRGDCSFVTKARNAQRSGAAGVVIADNTCLCSAVSCTSEPGVACENLEPIMADDGSGADISIPSFLLFKQDADPIKEVLKNNIQVRVQMQFSMPIATYPVSWELWTHPKEPMSREFLSDFKSAVVAMGKATRFTPHMFVYDGGAAGCMSETGQNECSTLCTNNGRYCAVDPDENFNKGISGADVVTECLRSLCVWKIYGQEDGIGIPWWNYIKEFLYRCDNPKNSELFKSMDCIKDAMTHAGVDSMKVENCMSDSGGLIGNQTNTLFEKQLKNKETQGVFLVPSVYVNQAPVRGGLEFATIFKALCASFDVTQAPSVCSECSTCTDEKQCIEKGKCTSYSTNNGSNSTSSGGVPMETFAIVIGSLSAFFIFVAFCIYQLQQRRMRDEVRGIMAEYMPVGRQGSGGRGGSSMRPLDTSVGIEDDSPNGDLHLTIS